MRGTASASWKERAPKRLMERLEALSKGHTAAGAMVLQPAVARQAQVLRVCFALGFAAGGVMGCLALLLLALPQPADTRTPQSQAESFAEPHLGLPRGLPTGVPATPSNGGLSSAVLDLPIWRHERANAPFSLRIAGGASHLVAESGLSVWLRQVPETAWLSKGQRQDEHTWVLRASDLEGLRLALHDGTPDVFDVVIEVVSAAGTMATQGIARVRVIEDPARVAAVMRETGEKLTAHIAPFPLGAPLRLPPGRLEPVATKQSPSRSAAGRAVGVGAPAPLQATAPVRPEGLSALGGPAHASDNRQIWWQLPVPDWTPFATATGGK
jgi:hypothetical protein